MNVLLGYEVGTGKAVEIPVLHMAVVGQTQQSGKTTTLEALIQRSGLRAVTFVTKRAEGSFESARRIPAYFRQYADWQSVSALLEAMLREKLKFERSWIMRACKGARNLKDVRDNVEAAQRESRRGLDESVYLTLSEYLGTLVPELERLPYSDRLDLKPGVNAIDISAYSLGVQSLVIRSVMEWVYEHERNTIVLIPEAWEFVPQQRSSPVKLAAVQLIRKGAAAGNFVWLDSQDLAGVDKEILKQVSVWILGVQREVNEVKRTLAHLPAGAKRPKPENLMQLGRGFFYVSHGRELRSVYVQPAWLSAEKARKYAVEELPASFVAKPTETKRPVHETTSPAHETKSSACETEKSMDANNVVVQQITDFLAKEFPGEFSRGATLGAHVIGLLQELKVRRSVEAEGKVLRTEPFPTDISAIAAQVLDKLKVLPEFVSLQLTAEKPELNVTVQRKVIEASGATLFGRLAQMVAEGWFDQAKTGNATFNELKRRGFSTAKPNVYRELDKLSGYGFLTKEGDAGYLAVLNAKVNITEAA